MGLKSNRDVFIDIIICSFVERDRISKGAGCRFIRTIATIVVCNSINSKNLQIPLNGLPGMQEQEAEKSIQRGGDRIQGFWFLRHRS